MAGLFENLGHVFDGFTSVPRELTDKVIGDQSKVNDENAKALAEAGKPEEAPKKEAPNYQELAAIIANTNSQQVDSAAKTSVSTTTRKPTQSRESVEQEVLKDKAKIQAFNQTRDVMRDGTDLRQVFMEDYHKVRDSFRKFEQDKAGSPIFSFLFGDQALSSYGEMQTALQRYQHSAQALTLHRSQSADLMAEVNSRYASTMQSVTSNVYNDPNSEAGKADKQLIFDAYYQAYESGEIPESFAPTAENIEERVKLLSEYINEGKNAHIFKDSKVVGAITSRMLGDIKSLPADEAAPFSSLYQVRASFPEGSAKYKEATRRIIAQERSYVESLPEAERLSFNAMGVEDRAEVLDKHIKAQKSQWTNAGMNEYFRDNSRGLVIGTDAAFHQAMVEDQIPLPPEVAEYLKDNPLKKTSRTGDYNLDMLESMRVKVQSMPQEERAAKAKQIAESFSAAMRKQKQQIDATHMGAIDFKTVPYRLRVEDSDAYNQPVLLELNNFAQVYQFLNTRDLPMLDWSALNPFSED